MQVYDADLLSEMQIAGSDADTRFDEQNIVVF